MTNVMKCCFDVVLMLVNLSFLYEHSLTDCYVVHRIHQSYKCAWRKTTNTSVRLTGIVHKAVTGFGTCR